LHSFLHTLIAEHVFTDSIILYFNETNALPIPGFVEEAYTHKYEKGWNTQFREGADTSNLNVSSIDISSPSSTSSVNTSLELYVAASKPDHLVVGSSLRTARRDIKYGSFTSLLRSPGQWAGGGGSALSMALEYNLTQLLTMDLQNTNMPSTASVSMLANEEFPDSKLGIPYGNMTNGTFGNGSISPWDYTEFRMDWTEKEVKFYIGGHLARSISKKENEGLLSTPSPFFLRHWSNGNIYSSQGPPKQTTVANVGWTRMFFNSSLMLERDHTEFDSRCKASDACLMSNMTLRGSSSYPTEATLEWKPTPKSKPKRKSAIWLAVGCICLTTFLLLNPLFKRVREKVHLPRKLKLSDEFSPTMLEPAFVSRHWDSRAETLAGSANITPQNRTRAPSVSAATLNEAGPASAVTTPSNRTRASSIVAKKDGVGAARSSAFHEDVPERPSAKDYSSKGMQLKPEQKAIPSAVSSKYPSQEALPLAVRSTDEITIYGETTAANSMSNSWKEGRRIGSKTSVQKLSQEDSKEMSRDTNPASLKQEAFVTPSATTEALTNPPEAKKRVDYLAGLVAVASLLVTAIHFNLTFVFGDLNAGAFTHYNSEAIARKTVNSFLLNLIWIGPFLMTSTRFLVSSYLRTGELLPVAEKTVGRVFRLMIPITAMVMLEYFLINCGATRWLEYLPSITWSTWPFTVGYTNFGNFISEVLELMYLIPNAAPIITFNYCTGVLWTIPVQLQGSWLTLLAVIVIREIKTPWKRFAFYAFCIVNHWYAVSWGSYFYFGIMLTDLDLTYKWRPYLHARPLAYYPLLLIFALIGIAGLLMDFITQWTNVNYATYEYAIHPDINSGLPISQAGHAGYPQYFVPRLNGIAFAVGFQAVVELSPAVQKLFSFKLLVLVFPHIFTIYLFHGFIFWSLGSWLCVTLAVHGLRYWLNILIVAIVCYTTLALCLPLLTPVVESLGKSITEDILQYAREEPAPRRPTLFPFQKDLFLGRYITPHEEEPAKDLKVDNVKDPERVV